MGKARLEVYREKIKSNFQITIDSESRPQKPQSLLGRVWGSHCKQSGKACGWKWRHQTFGGAKLTFPTNKGGTLFGDPSTLGFCQEASGVVWTLTIRSQWGPFLLIRSPRPGSSSSSVKSSGAFPRGACPSAPNPIMLPYDLLSRPLSADPTCEREGADEGICPEEINKTKETSES